MTTSPLVIDVFISNYVCRKHCEISCKFDPKFEDHGFMQKKVSSVFKIFKKIKLTRHHNCYGIHDLLVAQNFDDKRLFGDNCHVEFVDRGIP